MEDIKKKLKNNKLRGHNFEREFVSLLKSKSEVFSKAKTSREASRLYDDSKIDVWGIPLLVQLKNTATTPNSRQILKEMDTLIDKNFPKNAQERSLLKCVVHKKPPGQGKKNDKYTTTVTLTLEDFLDLITKYYK